MVTRALIKEEIDKVKEEYLTALYNIIKVFELPSGTVISTQNEYAETDWKDFIEQTYGCLKHDPAERAPQGEYEIRETTE